MKVLGVDVGSYSVKIAEMDVSANGSSLSGFYEYPLSIDPTKDRSLEVVEILRRLSTQYDPAQTRYVIGVPQHRVSAHHKRFPFKERPKILKSLAFELEDDIPLDIDDTVFDAKIIEYVGPLTDVLMVACPKDALDEAISWAKDGGFDPEIVSIEGLALANLYEDWNSPPPEISPILRGQGDEATQVGVNVYSSRIVLHMGHQRSLLLVYREEGLVAVRSILWGGSEIADAIARAMNTNVFEAMKILQSKSFILMNQAGANRDQILLSTTISGCVDKLVRELQLTLLEVKSAFSLNLTKIDLSGGACQIQNLGAYLTQALELPANISHPLENMKNVRLDNASPMVEAISPVAIGLAIEGAKRPRNPAINLRKGDFARENLTYNRFWENWRTPIQVAVAAFALFFVYSVVRDSFTTGLNESIDEKLRQVANEQAGLKGSAGNESGVRTYVSKQNKQIKLREEMTQVDSYSSAMEILARLSEKLPVQIPPKPGNGLNVTRLSVENDDVVIEGHVMGASLIPLIEKALAEIARPKSVAKAPSTHPPSQGTAFAYKMKVNRKQ